MKKIFALLCLLQFFVNGCSDKGKELFSSPESTVAMFERGWMEKRKDLIEMSTWESEERRRLIAKYGSGINFGPEGVEQTGYKILNKRKITGVDVKTFLNNNKELSQEVPYWLQAEDVAIEVERTYTTLPPMRVDIRLRLIDSEWKVIAYSYIPDENYPDMEPPPDI